MTTKLGLVIVLAIVLGLGAIAAVVFTTPEEAAAPPPHGSQVQIGKGVAQGERLHGHAWTADYEKITTNSDQSIVDLDTVRNGVIYKNGKPYLKVRATHLTVNTVTRDFSAVGPLHVERIGKSKFRWFESDAGTWTNATQKLLLPNKTTVGLDDGHTVTVGRASINIATGHIHLEHIESVM
jgi:hypothetical protein